MIKVLHFYKTYYPDSFGGVEQVIYQLSESGNCYGISSEVFSINRRGEENNIPFKHHVRHGSKMNFEFSSTPISFSAVKHFKQLAEKADIIHYHFPYPYMDLVHFLAKINKPTVLSYHSDIVKQKFLSKIYAPLMHRFLSKMDCIVAASPNYVDTSPVLQQYKDKVQVIPYGLDPSLYQEPALDIIDKWKVLIGERFFLFIGVFRYYKGLHILIEAAKNSTYPIVIVGTGEIANKLKKQVRRLNINNIYFLGALSDSDKIALLTLCTAVVFPSYLRSEAFGISLLEGALLSKPLISCEIGTGTSYINIDKETGIVVPPLDPLKLRQAMDTIWNHPEQAEQYGKQARKRFDRLFTANKMAQAYYDIYTSLV